MLAHAASRAAVFIGCRRAGAERSESGSSASTDPPLLLSAGRPRRGPASARPALRPAAMRLLRSPSRSISSRVTASGDDHITSLGRPWRIMRAMAWAVFEGSVVFEVGRDPRRAEGVAAGLKQMGTRAALGLIRRRRRRSVAQAREDGSPARRTAGDGGHKPERTGSPRSRWHRLGHRRYGRPGW